MATRLKHLIKAADRIILDGQVVTKITTNDQGVVAMVTQVTTYFDRETVVRHSNYVVQDVLEIAGLDGHPHTFEFQVFKPLRLPAFGE